MEHTTSRRGRSALARAIALTLGVAPLGAALAQSAPENAAASAGSAQAARSGQLEEVVVTAQRRTENVQNVPIAIQAFTGESLAKLNVATLDDFIRYLPNVTAPSYGPGQDSIFMRGLSAGVNSVQGVATLGVFPNVAIYLDDQSGQLPGRNLDVYAADLERIEVLEGPQGTLFGAGAQAGVVRYITNKPKLNVTEGYATAGYSTTAGGDPNSAVTGVLNLPLVKDTLAARFVLYSDQRGGYINNVPGTFTRNPADLGIHYGNYATGCAIGAPDAQGLCNGAGNSATAYGVPPGSPSISNRSIARNAFNPVSYVGIRGSLFWNINDDWNLLLTQAYQRMASEGVFYAMPYSSDGAPLPPQSVTLFNDSHDNDQFENTAWTLNGKLGALKAVYTGAYLVRHVDQLQDYTNYARGVYADYYQCHGAEPSNGISAACYTPSTTWQELERNTHQSHELRLSTPDEWRLRGILGAFWEEQKIEDVMDWHYRNLPECTATFTAGCMTSVGPPAGASVNNPATRDSTVAFFHDVKRGYRQYAFFTSIDFDLVPKVLTLTVGTRYYNFNNTEKGAQVSSFGCYEAGLAPCTAGATNIDAENLQTTYSGFKSRANLTWHATPDALVYYTWSQGFRAGAFNRSHGCYAPDANGVAQFCTPSAYKSDALTNNELGWKAEFLDHRLQWNGALYEETWKDVQVEFFDPGQLGNLGFATNGPDYRVRGVETSLIARITAGLTAQGGASWNQSRQTNSPYLIANNPDLLANPASKAEYGLPITSITNPYGTIGSPSANSPPVQFNLRLRYEWARNDYNSFFQVGATHTAHSYTQSSNDPSLSQGGAVNTTLLRFENPAYTMYDASLGVAKDAWTLELHAQNLTNVLSSVFTSTSQFVLAETIARPRILGLKLGYKF